ncbi:MAG: hypothetical protein ACRDHE_04750, partial [Ktedonobacterales bacterium]
MKVGQQAEADQSHATSASGASEARTQSLAPLVKACALIEALLLGLFAVAPVGGVSQSISPLARSWPILLAPARALFGDALVNGSVPPDREWPALALYAALLVGASCAAALAVLAARTVVMPTRRHLRLALVGALILGVTLILLPSLPSDDVFSYILYGRISAIHHANPLVLTPGNFPHDPFLSLVF